MLIARYDKRRHTKENLEPWAGGYTKKIARSIMISRIE